MYSYDLYVCPDRPLVPPEPVTVCKCNYCRDGIILHNSKIRYEGYDYHPDCFLDCAVALLMQDGAAVFIEGDETADEETVVAHCACCNEDVLAVEDHYVYRGQYYHYECFCDNAAHRLFELGAREDVAEIEMF